MIRAFTMIELVFVIVVIGILTGIAMPKFAATRDDATITKAKTTLSSIRSAITQEAQRRQMAGDYTPIFSLSLTHNSYNRTIFDYFDNNNTGPRVLEYPIKSCDDSNSVGCWKMSRKGSANQKEQYRYVFPQAVKSGYVNYELQSNRFVCIDTNDKCDILEH